MISLEGTSIFRRVIDPAHAALSPELARFIADLDFPPADHQKFSELSDKAQQGTLTHDERLELEGYLEVDSLLSMLRLNALKTLGPNREGR